MTKLHNCRQHVGKDDKCTECGREVRVHILTVEEELKTLVSALTSSYMAEDWNVTRDNQLSVPTIEAVDALVLYCKTNY